jgi:exodeoxyribonuclease VII large subunit
MIARLSESMRRIGDRLTDPQAVMSQKQHQIDMIDNRMKGRQEQIFERVTSRLDQLGRLLEASSYQKVLGRGFALVSDAGNGHILKTAEEARMVRDVNLTFADGKITAQLDSDGGKQNPIQRKPSKPHAKDQNKDNNKQGKLL